MSKQEKKGMVPERRFPEFQDKTAWELKELGDCLDYLQPTNFLVSSTAYNDKYDIPVLTAGKTFILGYTNETEGVFDKKLPVIIFDDFTTASKYVDFPFKAKSSAMKILLAKEDANIKFAYESMQMIKYEVGVHERHWISTFSKINIPAPNAKEQQKIADCLTSVDELITAEIQKLDALKTHKKGLMQQLFPAEGETVPKLRFPEFRDKREWEEKFIRDLGEIITGSTPSTSKPEYYGGDRLFVSPADISDQRFIEKTKTTLTELGFSETRPVKPGSILFVCIGSTIGKIAQNHHECATNQQINAVVPNANYANAFVYYRLESNSEKISGLAGNHAVPIINKTAFGAVEIRFPKLPEQQKIADCLTSIDELITVQVQKLDALKSHKKGLMQQLFPTMDEVEA